MLFSFFIQTTSNEEVEKVIHNIKVTSPGYDTIHIKMMKRCKNEISQHVKQMMMMMINQSFQDGLLFPKQLQVAEMVPIHKKGDKQFIVRISQLQVTCTHPSFLPGFGKIFDKIMAKRLMDYLTKKSLLTEHQFCFIKSQHRAPR